eukprot:5979954-Prymnesium_polylepis.1
MPVLWACSPTPSIIHGRAVAPATPFVTHGHTERSMGYCCRSAVKSSPWAAMLRAAAKVDVTESGPE